MEEPYALSGTFHGKGSLRAVTFFPYSHALCGATDLVLSCGKVCDNKAFFSRAKFVTEVSC